MSEQLEERVARLEEIVQAMNTPAGPPPPDPNAKPVTQEDMVRFVENMIWGSQWKGTSEQSTELARDILDFAAEQWGVPIVDTNRDTDAESAGVTHHPE